MNSSHRTGKSVGCALIALALTAPLTMAGETVVEPAPAPAPSPSMWGWFAGGSGGYLFDAENDIWNIHLGTEWTDGTNSHGIFLEIGWTEYDAGTLLNASTNSNSYWASRALVNSGALFSNITIDVVPVSLNYKFERAFSSGSAWNWYVGAGMGAAFTKTTVGWVDEKNTLFYFQAFGGVSWNVTEAFEVYSGLRYIYMEDPDTWIDGMDDGMVELGARFNF